MREETESVELVEQGCNTLVGADREKILAAEKDFLSRGCYFSAGLYGDGKAGEKIMERLKKQS